MWLKRVCAAGIGCLFFVIGSLYDSMKVGDERSTCVVPTFFFFQKKILQGKQLHKLLNPVAKRNE